MQVPLPDVEGGRKMNSAAAEGRYYTGVTRVRRFFSDDEANAALAAGGELLKIVEVQDAQFAPDGQDPLPLTKICYVVGWRQAEAQEQPAVARRTVVAPPAPAPAESVPPAEGGQQPVPARGKATAKMVNYIALLEAKASAAGASAVRDTLAAHGVSRVADLPFDAASQLIDRLRGMVPR